MLVREIMRVGSKGRKALSLGAVWIGEREGATSAKVAPSLKLFHYLIKRK